MTDTQNSPISQLLTPEELARELNISKRTLARWHVRRVAPARTRAGKKVYYTRESIDRWLKARTEDVA